MAEWKIYWIVNDTTNNVYVGSTELELRHRFALHLLDYHNWKRGKNKRIACRSRDVIDCISARIELLEENIETKEDALQRERWWYDKKKEEGFALTNRCRPKITKEEERESKRQSELRNPKTEAQKLQKKEKDKIRHQTEEFKQKNKERSAKLRENPEFREKRNENARKYRAKIKKEKSDT